MYHHQSKVISKLATLLFGHPTLFSWGFQLTFHSSQQDVSALPQHHAPSAPYKYNATQSPVEIASTWSVDFPIAVLSLQSIILFV